MSLSLVCVCVGVCVCVCVCVGVCMRVYTFQLILVYSDYYCIHFKEKSAVHFFLQMNGKSLQISMCNLTLSPLAFTCKKLYLIGLLILPIDSC